MGHNPRHQQIITLLQSWRTVAVADLSARLGVSEVTIRKDLTFLEERGLVHRSHGAASLAQSIEPMKPVPLRSGEQSVAKEQIAQAAATMVVEGDVVGLDAGSTTLELARLLCRRAVRVVSNSLYAMELFATDSDASLTAVGGNLRSEAGSFIGPIAEAAIASVRLDIAFIGATAFTADGCFYCQNVTEGQTKRRFLESAQRRVIVADAGKFNARSFSRFADGALVHMLITDSPFAGIDALREAGIEVLIAAAASGPDSAPRRGDTATERR